MQGGSCGRHSVTFIVVIVSKRLKISSIVTCGMDLFTSGRHLIANENAGEGEGAEGEHQNGVEDAWRDL